MTLNKWLTRKKIRPYHLSKVLKVSSASIWYHLKEGRPLTARLALIIEKHTKGEVTLREMVTPMRGRK
jgi:DNA-binding transcriptional regulator YdaS (Cro superfamily)